MRTPAAGHPLPQGGEGSGLSGSLEHPADYLLPTADCLLDSANAENPPSIGTTIPVTNAEAGDRSQSTAPNRSSGWPKRAMGVWSMIDLPRAVRFPGLLIGQEKPVLIGQEETRRNGVHANPRRVNLSHVHGQPLRKVADAGFGGRVGEDSRQGPEGAHGGDIENDPFAFFRHDFAEHLAGKDGSQDVQIEHPAQSIRGKIEETRGRAPVVA